MTLPDLLPFLVTLGVWFLRAAFAFVGIVFVMIIPIKLWAFIQEMRGQ